MARIAAVVGVAAGAGAAAIVAIRLATDSPDAVSALFDVARGAGATLLLFAVAGYAPARRLCPDAMRRHEALLVLPLGAAVSGLVLYALGLLHLPLSVSLALLAAAGLLAGIRVRSSRGPLDLGGGGEDPRLTLLAPAAIAVLVMMLLVAPMLRPDSFATVLGENGDAALATGAAELLQHAPPGSRRSELPIDHMPFVWDSKYPIYYVLAGSSTLSGLDPTQTFGSVIAVVGGLAVLGFYLLAYYVLGAGAAGSLAALALVALDRVVFRLGLDPFYNNLWGYFAHPLALMFGWWYLREPRRGTALLFALFLALAVLAYPLLAPYPALFLIVAGWLVWRRKRAAGESLDWIRALRLPRRRRWYPVYAYLGIVGAFVFYASFYKIGTAIEALLPGGDLKPWSGDTPGFHGVEYFLGAPKGASAIAVLTIVAGIVGLRRTEREGALPTGALIGALLLSAAYIDARGEASLFHFRALVFFAPLALAFAGIGLYHLVRDSRPTVRRVAIAGGAVVVAGSAVGAYQQVSYVFPHLTEQHREVDEWGRRLPPGASVRVDVTPVGMQQWAWYVLEERPLSASYALQAFFPHVPIGRKADYLLVNREVRPPDADGPPLFENKLFALYRMRADVPGPDRSSRALVDPPSDDGGVGT